MVQQKITAMKDNKTINAYKGFDKNMCCRGF